MQHILIKLHSPVSKHQAIKLGLGTLLFHVVAFAFQSQSVENGLKSGFLTDFDRDVEANVAHFVELAPRCALYLLKSIKVLWHRFRNS